LGVILLIMLIIMPISLLFSHAPGPGFVPLGVVDGVESPSKAQQKQIREEEARMDGLGRAAGRLGVGVSLLLGRFLSTVFMLLVVSSPFLHVCYCVHRVDWIFVGLYACLECAHPRRRKR